MILNNIYQILSYNNWANQRLVRNVNKVTDADYYKIQPIPFNNIHGLLSHLLYYDTKYYQKLAPELNTSIIENKHTRAYIAENILLSSSNWIHWIEKFMDINPLPTFSEEIAKNIFDLSIHSSYHRGQINIILSVIDYKPESLDIFLFNDSVAE